MAIAVGSRVRPRLTSSTLAASLVNPQPPVLAVVTRIIDGGEGPDAIVATVAENGITWAINASALSPTGVNENSLDEITPPDDLTREAFINKVVVGIKADGETRYAAEYIGTVVDVYVVNGVANVLVKTQTGLFYELPITRIAIIPFR